MERKTKVSYYGEIWTLEEQINESIFEEFKKYYPRNKMLISHDRVTKNVEIDKITLIYNVKQKTPEQF